MNAISEVTIGDYTYNTQNDKVESLTFDLSISGLPRSYSIVTMAMLWFYTGLKIIWARIMHDKSFTDKETRLTLIRHETGRSVLSDS